MPVEWPLALLFFFFNDPAPPDISPLPLPAPLPIPDARRLPRPAACREGARSAPRHPAPREPAPRAIQSPAAPAAVGVTSAPRAILADLDEHLAEVPAAQQADERLGRLLEALDDVLAVLQLALAQPARAVGEELRHPVGVVADDEAADGDAVDEHRRQVRPRRHLRGVVLGDDAAERDACERVDVFQYGLQHVAADVVEVHVDAVRTGVAQHGPEFRHAVGHASVEVEVLEHVLALLPAGGDPDRAAAADLRELADDGADGAGGGGDDDRLARLGLADVVEADVRGHARHAEDAERGGDRRRFGIELERAERPHARAAALRHVVGLPAAVG